MNPVRQIVDGTNGNDPPTQAEMAKGNIGTTVAKPEEVMEQLRQQATHLGPVLEAILKESQGQGRSHWGLNE